jgi:subtilisin family serine protease
MEENSMRTSKNLYKTFSMLVVMVMLLGLVSPMAATPAKAAPQAQAPEPKSQPKVAEPKDDLTKLHPDLRAVVETQTANRLKVGNAPAKPEEPVLVQAVFEITTTLETIKGFFVEGKAGLRPYMGIKNTKQGILTGQILPSKLVKLASRPEVTFVIPIVMEKNGEPDDEKPAAAKPTPEDWAKLRAQAADLRSKVKEPSKVIKPKDWFEVTTMGPHKAEAAWSRDVTGEGVTVAVNDDGVDFAHPDLIGTQKIIETGPYAGWPMAFSPFSMLAYYLEQETGAPYISGGYSGTYYADTSTVPTVSLCGGPGCRMFEYTPLIDFLTPGYTHTYFFDSSMSKSGMVHVGTHPDRTLRDFVWGEIPAILVTGLC